MDISQRLLISLIESNNAHRRSLNGLKDVFRAAYGSLKGFLIDGEYYEMLDQLSGDRIDNDYFVFLCGQIKRGDTLSTKVLMFQIRDHYPESVWEHILCVRLGIKKEAVVEAIKACS